MAGDPDGRALRKVLARLDIAGGRTVVRRVPAWRCLAESELAAELSEHLHRLEKTAPSTPAVAAS